MLCRVNNIKWQYIYTKIITWICLSFFKFFIIQQIYY